MIARRLPQNNTVIDDVTRFLSDKRAFKNVRYSPISCYLCEGEANAFVINLVGDELRDEQESRKALHYFPIMLYFIILLFN